MDHTASVYLNEILIKTSPNQANYHPLPFFLPMFANGMYYGHFPFVRTGRPKRTGSHHNSPNSHALTGAGKLSGSSLRSGVRGRGKGEGSEAEKKRGEVTSLFFSASLPSPSSLPLTPLRRLSGSDSNIVPKAFWVFFKMVDEQPRRP